MRNYRRFLQNGLLGAAVVTAFAFVGTRTADAGVDISFGVSAGHRGHHHHGYRNRSYSRYPSRSNFSLYIGPTRGYYRQPYYNSYRYSYPSYRSRYRSYGSYRNYAPHRHYGHRHCR